VYELINKFDEAQRLAEGSGGGGAGGTAEPQMISTAAGSLQIKDQIGLSIQKP
jgi:hypothetical protein